MADFAVLVIDDDKDVLSFLTVGLQRAGFQVATALNGNQGMEMLSRQIFNVVISDIVMDDGEGIETLKRIRRQYPDLPAIGISGMPIYLKMFERLGGTATLAKPFHLSALIDLINHVINNETLGNANRPPVN